MLSVDESLLEENVEVRRIIAAESTRLFTALFAAINDRVCSLAPAGEERGDPGVRARAAGHDA